MNEFEWRRQMRELRQPLTPPRDMWSSIDAALTRAEQDRPAANETLPPSPRRPRPHWLLGAAVAASLLLAGSIAWRAMHAPAVTQIAEVAKPARAWKPNDPRLAGAAIELNAAQMELRLALRQAPDSPSLQRLLDRTETQQSQLRQLANQAG